MDGSSAALSITSRASRTGCLPLRRRSGSSRDPGDPRSGSSEPRFGRVLPVRWQETRTPASARAGPPGQAATVPGRGCRPRASPSVRRGLPHAVQIERAATPELFVGRRRGPLQEGGEGQPNSGAGWKGARPSVSTRTSEPTRSPWSAVNRAAIAPAMVWPTRTGRCRRVRPMTASSQAKTIRIQRTASHFGRPVPRQVEGATTR